MIGLGALNAGGGFSVNVDGSGGNSVANNFSSSILWDQR